MGRVRTIAFIRYRQSLRSLGSEAVVLPLSPGLPLSSDQLLAPRPEALLLPADFPAIEESCARIVSGWAEEGSIRAALRFEGLDVADCLSTELSIPVRDILKTGLIIERALEEVEAEEIVIDDPPLRGPLPAYPYLDALGSLAEAVAAHRGLRLNLLRTMPAPRAAPKRHMLEAGYLFLAARQALRHLRSSRFILAAGPFPEFYRPVAAAAHRHGTEMIVTTKPDAPLRPDWGKGLFLLPVNALMNRERKQKASVFVARGLRALHKLNLAGVLPRDDLGLAGVLRYHITERFRIEADSLISVACGFQDGLARAEGLIVVETSAPLSRAMTLCARRYNIPVALLQHGVIARPFGYKHFDGDRVAAWGPADAKWFRDNLREGVVVEATGSPRYDSLVRPARRRDTISQPRRARGAGVVMFASQPFVQGDARESPWEKDSILGMVLQTARETPPYVYLIKWHPSEEPEDLREIGKELGGRLRQVHRGDTFTLLRHADLVLARSSTVALEAMYLDRPVVFLGAPDPESPFRPPEEGAGLRATTPADLKTHIVRIMESPDYRREVLVGQRSYLRRSYAPLDGQAAERVVDLLRAR